MNYGDTCVLRTYYNLQFASQVHWNVCSIWVSYQQLYFGLSDLGSSVLITQGEQSHYKLTRSMCAAFPVLELCRVPVLQETVKECVTRLHMARGAGD